MKKKSENIAGNKILLLKIAVHLLYIIYSTCYSHTSKYR